MKNKNLGDWAIALTVVTCSAVLLIALLFALTGSGFTKPSRIVLVNFHDVTGVSVSAAVKYAGAKAGKVAMIRMLSPEERLATGDPLNAVQVTLALNKNVPPLPDDIKASVAADTLLSDKFILLSGGSPQSEVLANGAVLQGITPTTFDKLARDVDSAIEGIRGLMGGTQGETKDVFERLRLVLENTQGLLDEAKPVVTDARALAADARQLIAENKVPVTRAVKSLDQAAVSISQLSAKGNSLLTNNEKKINASIASLLVSIENLKVTSTYTKIFSRNLALKPSQIIWGGRPPILPTETEILRSAKPIE